MFSPTLFVRLGCIVIAVFGACTPALADWPTYLHDAERSGVTQETITLPLEEAWTYQAAQPPRPAWPAPANQDFWHEIPKLHPVVTYDRAFHAVIADDRLYFASSADDQVYCLDAATGETRWTFFAQAPIRLAPTISEGKAYFSSDDGYVYCLESLTGALVWKYRPPVEDRRIPGNGRLVSTLPCRTGVLVENGTAYCFAGMFPDIGVYCTALNAADGAVIWSERAADVPAQGYLLASSSRLYVPTGRTNPFVFDRSNGKCLGALEGPGGAFAVLAEDALASGPGRQSGNTMLFADPSTRETIATAPATRMVVKGAMAYLQSLDRLSALDRPPFLERGRQRLLKEKEREACEKQLDQAKRALSLTAMKEAQAALKIVDAAIADIDKAMEACYQWHVATEHPYALILAGDILFAGGEGDVAAFSAKDGAALWKAPIPGRAYGLSVSDGRLYVSTDQGTIHCFAAPSGMEKQTLAPPPAQNPFPENAPWAALADKTLQETGIRKGFALVLQCGEGRLVYELAQRSDLHVIGLESDPEQAASARARLKQAGLYGHRTAILEWDGLKLPMNACMANLIVSGDRFRLENALPAAEVCRVLRPFGGAALIGQPDSVDDAPLIQWKSTAPLEATLVQEPGRWALFRRGALADAGEWTQLYANSAHTACSADPLKGPTTIQWFGEPGPRDMVDRHHRPMSSLFKDGRLFTPGNDLVFCIDAYNGAPIWKLEAPGMRRVGAMKDNGQMLVTNDFLYIAVKGECWAVNVATGEHAFSIPIPDANGVPYDWGYLDCLGDLLFGTAEIPEASFDLLSRDLVNMIENDYRQVITSKYLFCVDRHSGEKRWIYRNGALMNSAIAIADGRIYFAQSRNEKALSTADGRIRIDYFCKTDTTLTALDATTGAPVWERPVAFPYEHIMFLNGDQGVLLATGSFNDKFKLYYGLFAFDMASGKDLWNTQFQAMDNQGKNFAEIGGTHGEQWQHPVLNGGVIYQRPFAFDLHTGAKKDFIARRGGHGCGGLSGSEFYLFGRGNNPRMYPLDVTETDGIQLSQVNRPGCWLNIIPAGGIILVPESSSGCTCGYPIQASFAFIPQTLN